MKKFYFKQNEEIYDDKGNCYSPHYSTEKTDKYFENLLENFIKSEYFKKVNIGKINCISVIFQDLFWIYSFNFIKYKNLIEKVRDSNIKFIKNPKNFDYYSNGYEKFKKFKNGNNLSFRSILIFFYGLSKKFLSKINILLFIFSNLVKNNRNKIWISPDLVYHENFKLFNLKDKSNLIIMNSKSFYNISSTYKFSTKNINHSIYLEIITRLSNYSLWRLAIKLLKPKKILLQDNLFNDWSIFLASKQSGVQCIGVTHGLMTKYHKNIIGSDLIKNIEILKFDKVYTWCEEFKNEIKKHSKIYNEDSVFISGWISNKDVTKKQLNIFNNFDKYVLHAFEINSNFLEIERIMKFFQDKNYKIILKKRPPFNNYFQFEKINNIEIVNDFSKEHIEKAFCSICNASTYIINYKAMNIPIVIPRKEHDGYNFFFENHQNIFEFSPDIESKIKNSKLDKYDFPEITETFEKEFN